MKHLKKCPGKKKTKVDIVEGTRTSTAAIPSVCAKHTAVDMELGINTQSEGDIKSLSTPTAAIPSECAKHAAADMELGMNKQSNVISEPLIVTQAEDNTTPKILKQQQQNDDLTTTPKSWPSNHINSVWWYHPISRVPEKDEDNSVYRVELNRPYATTRLIKTLSFGLNPQILKENLDLNMRRKTITLVGFRKNGIFPRQTVKMPTKLPSSQSAEIAVLQSPFNDVGQFWYNNPEHR
ncbi:hypothetical protein O0L34_g2598 [Tuta absoluta]|nr:hypothetical protein O0L34_g2598 [Tuta absoluta]